MFLQSEDVGCLYADLRDRHHPERFSQRILASGPAEDDNSSRRVGLQPPGTRDPI